MPCPKLHIPSRYNVFVAHSVRLCHIKRNLKMHKPKSTFFQKNRYSPLKIIVIWTHLNILKCLFFYSLILLLLFSVTDDSQAEDAYSLFGKLFLSGRVEYDFTNRRNFLADTENEIVRQDHFDFDRLFRRGFHSVLVIEETAGNVKKHTEPW